MSSYPAAADHAAVRQGPAGAREAQEHHGRRVILTSSPTSSNCSNLGQTAHVNMHSCLNLSSPKARYFNSIKGRRMTVAPKHMLVGQDDLSKQNQPMSVICLRGMT